MLLYLNCRACSTEIPIASKAISRPYLADELGDNFNKQCPKCAAENTYHINQVYAKESNLLKVLGTVIGVLVIGITTLGFFNFGYLTNIGFLIGFGIIAGSFGASATSTSKAFNNYRLPQKK